MARTKKAAAKRTNRRTAPRGKVVSPEFPRITVHPGRMSGNPCIRDMRITVGNVLNWFAAGHTEGQILEEFPFLEVDDLREACAFGAWLAERRGRLQPTA
jgi:uncharacterized protein (DUF433 family)